MLECVVNLSEGRDHIVLGELAATLGSACLDVHADPDHNRSVFTLIGEEAPRTLATAAVHRLDVRTHRGVHPRLGVVDVVPFTPLVGSVMEDALAARNRFGAWLAATLDVPGFAYGPERSLPDVRREAFRALAPTWGPPTPHRTGGASCVGARPVLVAYNIVLRGSDAAAARRIAAAVRGPHVRALGLAPGSRVQVSMNLVAPETFGPAEAYDVVASMADVDRGELVGLLPEAVLLAIDPARWEELGLSADRTIEHRLATARADARHAAPNG